MPIMLLEKDPFVEAESTSTLSNYFVNQYNIRRPFYGIQIKDPRHAFISIFQDGGSGSLVPISMKDSSAPGGWSNANHNLILTDVAESRQEKMQIIETFGDHYTFFYGEKPIILNCSGMLINTPDFNWKGEWWYNYENFLRGTKCVEHRARVFLGFDDVLVQGYVLNCAAQYSKDQPYVVPISFSILLAKPPLNLTPAEADEVPSAGSTEWVNQAAEVRTLSDGTPVEYIGSQLFDVRYSLNPITGDSEFVSGSGPNAPTNSGALAPTLAEDQARQWKTEEEALHEINVEVSSQLSGQDNVSSRQAARSNPESTPLGARTDETVNASASLSTGVSNSASVISDYTGVV